MTSSSRAPWIFSLLWLLTVCSIAGCLQLIFFRCPIEAQMGIVQKVFYFHVPSAYSMYLGAAACLAGSAWYLVTNAERADAIARAGAEVSVLFGVIVLVTGPLWAVKAWGQYWTWDPRLTTTLLSVLVYVSYVMLRSFAGGGEATRRFAAALGVLGALNLPVIHFAVRKWRGQHPHVLYLDPAMHTTLLAGFAAFTLLTLVLMLLRVQVIMGRERISQLEQLAAQSGLLDEDR